MFDATELNYSKIRAFQECPHLYKFIYEDRKFPPLGPYASLGLSVHGALARFHAAGSNGTLEDLLLCYDLAWNHRGFETAAAAMEFYEKGEAVLRAFHTAHSAAPAAPLFHEKVVRFEFGRWKVRGTLDRVDSLPDGGVELIDYKLGFDAQKPPEPAGSLQLLIYAAGLRRELGLQVKKISYFVLNGTYKVSAVYDPAEEERTLARLNEAGEGLLALDLSRKGDCASCVIRKLCPASAVQC
jgi:RecB family exonuclease